MGAWVAVSNVGMRLAGFIVGEKNGVGNGVLLSIPLPVPPPLPVSG